MLGLGIIGAGYMGRHHALAIQRLADEALVSATIVAIYDPDSARAATVAGKCGAKAVSTAEAVIEDPRVDAVIIASPVAVHREQVLATARRKKALLCEKPLAPSVAEAEEMAAAVKQAGIIAHVGLVLRHQPSLWKLREIIRSEQYGRVRAVVYRHDSCIPEGGERYVTALEDRLVQRGIIWEENIHDLDLLLYLFGDVHVRHSQLLFESPTAVYERGSQIMFGAQAGFPITFSSIWHDIAHRGSSRRIEVFFDKTMISSEFFVSGDLLVHEQKGEPTRMVRADLRRAFTASVFPGRPALADERRFHHYAIFADLSFVDAVEAGHSGQPSFGDALAAHRLAEMLYRKPSRPQP